MEPLPSKDGFGTWCWSPSWFNSLHHIFPICICTQILLLSWATSTHWKVSNNFWAASLTVKSLDVDANNLRGENVMWFILWNICLSLVFLFCSLLCNNLQAQFQLYQTRHLWCNSNSQTGERRNAALHMLRAPLYARAKPIIHVEICLGKLGSTLENKQPETGELHWCFRATLMSCRLMEALPRTQTYCKGKLFFFFFFLQDITLQSIVFNLSWQNGF